MQVTPHRGQPPPSAGVDVFDDDPFRAQLSDDSSVFKPEAGAGAFFETRAFTGGRYVLAWEASAEAPHAGEVVRSDCPDVSVPLNFWPMFLQHSLAQGVNLDLPRNLADACTLET